MEGDTGSERGNNGSNQKIANSNEGQSKPKRQMKTPFQLENLEKTYALDTYPSEAMRAELSEKLGLSDRQLQMWFCHRRLKDKKHLPSKNVAAEPLPDSPTDDMKLGPELGNEYGSGSGSGCSPFNRSESPNMMPRGLQVYYESPQAVIECVEAQLGEPLREDGPILGVEFDPLPPNAFGAPIAVTEQPKRPRLAYDSKIGMNSHFTDNQIVRPESPHVLPSGQVLPNNMRIEKKRKSDDARITREVEAHEMKIKKELEKQDNLRRKSEERMKKEMEKQDRERRKEEERLMRERQREEERTKREQKREIERREKHLLKENLRAEKLRQKEELHKEKEAERRKAALEKATARRIAKESMELIEDKQLELMVLAASSKGFSSIIDLDFDTLQNLESYKDSLCVFPPKSVKLRKPFAIQPWINSEENVGNLLMVWRFLITFADVLELWPFNLDEFMQAFHDYDSRLLGEIHVALLKLIIKDIEDVARTPTGLGMKQNGAVNSGCGHPEIVEGAYAWGFDLRNWHKHLNHLTWPEILRQLALSAGYGPQLKKRSITRSYEKDKDEGRSCEDIISALRNGSAAKNAFAKMQEKGLLAPRRSRHRLTPGTVKFAAFHVLSLEGSKGLTVLELAEKIQKSGLRDLTTSKTPEASISVALSRDAKLFERIAASTYRVRSAFRKDPADAESILSEARKKIQIYENGFQAGEDADDVEREEECEIDEVDDDPVVHDLVNPSIAKKTSELCDDLSSNGKENLVNDVELQDEFNKDMPCFPENGSKNTVCPSTATGQPVACEDLNAGNLGEDNMEIDESKSVESWVQGLTEGEYSSLSVEERLNALVVLVGMANEGNSIRVVLEDRLEASNALKKQMWAEAQTDNPQAQLSAEYPKRSRSTLKSYISHIAEEISIYRSLPLGQDRRSNRYWQFVASSSCNDPGSGRIFVDQHDGNWRLIDTEEAFNALLSSLDSRGIRESHLRLMLLKIEKPLKENVQKNTLSNKIGSRGETCVKNEADETDSSPDLQTGTDSPSSTLCGLNSDASETPSSFKIELGKSESEKKAALRRYEDFHKWMWKECYLSSILCAMKHGRKRVSPLVDICDNCLNPYFFEDSHCNFCYHTLPSNNGFNFSKHASQCGDKLSKDISILDSSLPSQITLFKALLAFIEASVPPEAFQSFWKEDIRRHWGVKLSKSSSAEELLQILTLLERALKRDFLSSTFTTTEELLWSGSMSESVAHTSTNPESVAILPWVPQTTAVMFLRLFEFDGSIIYVPREKTELREEKNSGEYIKLAFKSSKVVEPEPEPADSDHDDFMKVKSAPMKIARSSNIHGRGIHDKGWGEKLSKRMCDSKRDTSRI